MQAFEIPLEPRAQSFGITLNGKTYYLRTTWCQPSACWIMDLADADQVPLVSGIPFVTGADLLQQFEYLGLGGAMLVQTDSSPDLVPSYGALGITGHLYFITQ